MKIGILGSGNVGGALGSAFAAHGHEVYFGVRRPDSAEMRTLLERCGPRARAESHGDAVLLGEVVINALSWAATRPVLESLDFGNKPLLDCSNPIQKDLSGLEIGTTTSAGEMVAQWARSSRVVKIFNTTGFNNMTNPHVGGHKLTMFYCGDDAEAKQTAATLAHDIGFQPIDAGPLLNSRQLEAMAMLWVWLAVRGGMGRDFGFQLVKR